MMSDFKLNTYDNTQTPPSTYIPDVTQRLIKKRALASQQNKGVDSTNENDNNPTENVKRKHYDH